MAGLSGIETLSNAAYPERSIRIVVPATAGGGNDAISFHERRLFVEHHKKKVLTISNTYALGDVIPEISST